MNIILGSRQRVGGDSWADNLHLTQEQQHPGMNPNPAERGRELGEENACGGQCVGTGGHGKCSGCSMSTNISFKHSFNINVTILLGSRQRVGGEHSTDNLKFTQEQLHPGMNPDPAERGAELGRENADGFNCVGNGGHGARAAKIGT